MYKSLTQRENINFNGRRNKPYTENDTPDPLNAYGVSKLAGESFVRRANDHYVVRVASLFGKTGCRAKGGKNFIETMLNLVKTKDSLQVTSNIIFRILSKTFTTTSGFIPLLNTVLPMNMNLCWNQPPTPLKTL